MPKDFLASAAMAALPLGMALPAAPNTLFFQMNPNIDTCGSRSVFVFGQAGSSGFITNGVGFSNNFTLGASGFAVIDLPLPNELANATVENKGFKITSDSAISGYYLKRRTASTDMTYLIDGDWLGTDHFAVGYQNNLPAGPVMRIAGVPFERDVAALALVASGQIGTNVQIDFGYRGQLGKALKCHGVRGGVTVQF